MRLVPKTFDKFQLNVNECITLNDKFRKYVNECITLNDKTRKYANDIYLVSFNPHCLNSTRLPEDQQRQHQPSYSTDHVVNDSNCTCNVWGVYTYFGDWWLDILIPFSHHTNNLL